MLVLRETDASTRNTLRQVWQGSWLPAFSTTKFGSLGLRAVMTADRRGTLHRAALRLRQPKLGVSAAGWSVSKRFGAMNRRNILTGALFCAVKLLLVGVHREGQGMGHKAQR